MDNHEVGRSLRVGLSSATPIEPVPVSPVPASIPSAAVVEHLGESVTWYKVRNGWEWGSIFVRPIDEGAEVVAHSSFGTFAYTWIAMGKDGWRKFLPSCSREYAMRKMAGRAYDVPLDREEFVVAMRDAVDDHERSVIDGWGIADSEQEDRLKRCREALDDDWGWEDVPLEALFWHFNEQASGAPYAMELYETRMTKINPQVVGFWDVIWLPFCDYLAQAISTGTAETLEAAQGEACERGPSGCAQPHPEHPHAD